MILCFSYAEQTDMFDKDGLIPTHTREQLLMLLRDLGMGKETSFSYPWRPDKSPNFCQNADKRSGPGGFVEDAYIEYPPGYNGGLVEWTEYRPGKACNEFIFTRA